MLFNLSPIQMEWFYDLDGCKTYLNWFLLEFALENYSFIQKEPALKVYREQYTEQQIAQYCAYLARRMQKSLFDRIYGRTKHTHFYQEYIDDFYTHHDHRMNGALGATALAALNHLQSACEACGQQCLSNYNATCRFFDEYKD